jgi:hypothetical protein
MESGGLATRIPVVGSTMAMGFLVLACWGVGVVLI